MGNTSFATVSVPFNISIFRFIPKMHKLAILLLTTSCLAYASGLECYDGIGSEVPEKTTTCIGYNACLKTFFKGTPELTVRGCGPEDFETDCKKDTGICTCTTDLCNGAHSFKPAIGVIFAMLGVLITRFL